MAKTFLLELVTPEKVLFSEEITSLVVPSHEGYLGVLAGHAPLLCALQPGEIRVETEGDDRSFSVSGGFVEIGPDKTIILCEAAEALDAIDVARAEKALERARKRLESPAPDLDRERARAAVARAANRLKLARKRKT